MAVTVFTEALHPGAFIVSEAQGMRSREEVVVAVSQTISAGEVLGKTAVIADATSSAAADAGNTGNGTITLDVTTPVLAAAMPGVYRAVCIEPATNLGTFAVFDPNGTEIGTVVVGGTFANQIKFVIADGSTDFIAGDAFSITVGIESVTDEQYKALDTAATDGTQHAAGIAVSPITTSASATGKIAIIDRDAEVRAADLTWPAGISAANKAKATEELRARGIKLR